MKASGQNLTHIPITKPYNQLIKDYNINNDLLLKTFLVIIIYVKLYDLKFDKIRK